MDKKSFENTLFILYTVAIGLFFLGDIFRKIALFFNCDFTRYSTVSKIVVLFLFLGFFLTNLKNYRRQDHFIKIITCIIVLIISFFAGQISLDNITQPLNITLNIEYLVKYLFLPIIILMFLELKDKSEHIEKIVKIFEWVFLINAAFILIGFCFNINELSTYSGDRFGYIGIFSRSGQASVFSIIFILLYYWQIKFKKNYLIKFKFIFSVIVSLLLGTKRIYIFLIILLLYFILIDKGYKKRATYRASVLIILTGLLFNQLVIKSFNRVFIVFQNNYYNKGFLYSLTSSRSDLFLKTFDDFVKTNWTLPNYFFGGASFQNYIFITGMDFFDLFLFFGLIGVVIYFKIFSLLINFKHQDSYIRFYLIILGIISFFSSSFLYDPYVNLLFVVTIWYFNNHKKKLPPQITPNQTI